MAESKIQTSFAAGELSPNLYARVDLDKFTVGAALMRNFLVDWRGGASNRAGSTFCGLAKSQGARLIPFEFSTDVTYMMEFGDHYIRFYHDADRVVEAPVTVSGITNESPASVYAPSHGYSTGQWAVLQSSMPQWNGRPVIVTVTDANNFTITSTYGVPIDSTNYPAFTGQATVSRVYEISSPYALADVFAINYTQSADVVTLVHPLYPPQNLSRVSAAPVFTIAPEVTGAVIQPPTNLTGSPTSVGNKHNYGYVVTAVNEQGTEESLPSNPCVVPAALLDETGASAGGIVTVVNLTWQAPAGQVASTYNIYKWGPVLNASGVPATVYGYIGQTQATAFQDANFAPDFSKTPNDDTDPFSPGQIQAISVLSGQGGTGYTGSYVPLTITGDGSGAIAYGIVDYASGSIVAAIIVDGGVGYTHATVSAGTGGASFSVEIGPPSGTYPSVVSFVQQRRAFAAPLNNPEGIVLSQIGNYNNFNSSPIVLDSDAITIDLASGVVNYIRSMTPMSTGLIILSSGGAFLMSGGTPGTPITPSNVTATRQASHGANFLPALVVNYDVLYMQNKGNTVRDLAFNFYLQSYVGNDRSTLSAHLFTEYNFVEWAWAQEPLKLVAVVRSDGILLTLTYVPEQEVYGWSWHDTQGLFKSVAVCSEGTADAIYVIVRRFIPNTSPGWYDMVERLDNRQFDCVEDACFLDASVSNEKVLPNYDLYLLGNQLTTSIETTNAVVYLNFLTQQYTVNGNSSYGIYDVVGTQNGTGSTVYLDSNGLLVYDDGGGRHGAYPTIVGDALTALQGLLADSGPGITFVVQYVSGRVGTIQFLIYDSRLTVFGGVDTDVGPGEIKFQMPSGSSFTAIIDPNVPTGAQYINTAFQYVPNKQMAVSVCGDDVATSTTGLAGYGNNGSIGFTLSPGTYTASPERAPDHINWFVAYSGVVDPSMLQKLSVAGQPPPMTITVAGG